RSRHTRSDRDWSSDVCSSDLGLYSDPPSSDDPLPQGKPAPAVEIGYPYGQKYTVRYRYNTASGRYLRFMNGQPHVDNLTQRQIRSEERRVGKECRGRQAEQRL